MPLSPEVLFIYIDVWIARKNDVLVTNNDAASAYGSKLNLLADQLHEDIETFKSVHSDFGSMLNEELNAFASRSSKSLEEDKSYLDGQLENFGQAIQRSKASFGKHHEDALALNADVTRAQEELQQNLMVWMTEQRQVAEKAIQNIKHVQETHLAVVSGLRLAVFFLIDNGVPLQVDTAIGHISETLGVLVTDALDHTKENLKSVALLQRTAEDASQQEVS